jgi:hypothetical protein
MPQMTAIEKTGEISIAVVRDSIELVSKVPEADIQRSKSADLKSQTPGMRLETFRSAANTG